MINNGISLKSKSVIATKYWHSLGDGRVQCDLCPRKCRMRDGQRGMCFVRANVDDQVVLATYGRSSGFAIDPIEKKPLNHFYPGSSVLSFGTAGCNLACKFCQNWDISRSKQMDALMHFASPESIANKAKLSGCKSVAYTYNDPVIFHEYAIDTAVACAEQGIKSVAVTAGYVCSEPRIEFFNYMDAVNIDLKAFSENFYWKLTGAHLQPVLETLEYVARETSVWLEITTLLIPGSNDDEKEIHAMSAWIVDHLGTDVPLHFSAFHPDYKLIDVSPTSLNTLQLARKIALSHGLKYVYTGNVHDQEGDTTFCHQCYEPLIVRDWYQLKQFSLQKMKTKAVDPESAICSKCGASCAGRFDDTPGDWGAKRTSVII